MTFFAGRIGEPFRAVFDFETPELRPYKQRSADRLNFILEQIDLGSNANLGYTKVTWLPDAVVRVRFLRMEGILEPIIVVRVEFQEAHLDRREQAKRLAELAEEQQEDDDPDDETYRPFAWIGIRAVNHSKPNIAPENPNCAFWGYAVDPHLCGFDPRPLGESQVDYDYTKTCESYPISHMEGTAFAAFNTGFNADKQRFFVVSDGQDFTENQFCEDSGNFQWQDYTMPFDGEVNASHSNMVLLELLDVRVTEPDAAVGWNAKRAIVIAPQGINFPTGSRNADFEIFPGCVLNMFATYSGGSIVSSLLGGEYEIQAFSQNYSCECTQADIELRVILGEFGGNQMVFDFTVPGIGSPPENNTQFYFREVIMGGYFSCRDDFQNAFGPCDHGVGWSTQSLFVDVVKGTVRQGTATILAPHFNRGCATTKKFGPKAPGCVGCIGDPTLQPANSLDYPGGESYLTAVNSQGNLYSLDLRGGVLWHLARVTQVDNVSGFVCRVLLVGNDGGQGECVCRPFSYHHNMPAIGVSANIPIGVDLRDFADSGQVPYQVGELVVVIGWSNPITDTCKILPGDWFLIVTRTSGGHDENFRNEFWAQLRCPETAPVEKFFKSVEVAFRDRAPCDGPPSSVKCKTGSECQGQLTCSKPELPGPVIVEVP